MYGAIIGDICGSRFEFDNIKRKDFELFTKYNTFTDDSVMTIAVGKALSLSKKNGYEDLEEKLIFWMHEIGQRYPYCGFGGRFYSWIMNNEKKPYHSYGNGAGMRTSRCGEIAESLDEALMLAKRCAAVSHDHEEGIKGAQSISSCIYLAGNGKDKKQIRDYVEEHFYKLDFTLDQIRPSYRFDVSCQGSVPQAIEAFLEAESFEDCIRNAISIGGDSDTIAAMAGSIGEAYYGIEESFVVRARSYLDDDLLHLVDEIL